MMHTITNTSLKCGKNIDMILTVLGSQSTADFSYNAVQHNIALHREHQWKMQEMY